MKRSSEKTIALTWFKYNSRIMLYTKKDDRLVYGIHFQVTKTDGVRVDFKELVPIIINTTNNEPVDADNILIAKMYVLINIQP